MDGYYQISIVAAFLAGMIALFAPCCVTYLLPAYLGNIFKERKRVILMTLIYSLGIFVVMLPVVLGAKMLSDFFFKMHDEVYLIGGLFMVVVAAASFLGLKLPMPRIAFRGSQKTDVVSTFTLGLISGVTSACCAPVLFGVMALSSLSPTLLLALGVGAAYVLGMVTPLYVASLLIDKVNFLERPVMKKRIWTVQLGDQVYPIFVSNLIATVVFGVVGGLTIYLTLNGKIAQENEENFMKWMTQLVFQLSGIVNKIPLNNLVGVGVGGYLLYRFIKRALK